MAELSAQYPRYGYRRIAIFLARDGHPMMTSNYLSLIKNSSLAVAIGYPDLVNIANTTANQTGQALEAIMIMMIVYLGINLTVSLCMNVYNARHKWDPAT